MPKPTPAQDKILGGDLYTAFLSCWSKRARGILRHCEGRVKESDFVTGWITTQGENLRQSEDFWRGRLQQDERDVQHEAVWGILLPKEYVGVVDELMKKKPESVNV